MEKIYLKNVSFFQAETERFVPAAVLLRNGIIAETGTLPPPADAEIVDGRGGYLIPGLIDCHTHLSLDCGLPHYLERMNGVEPALRQIAENTLARDLKSGVTTQRCMGDRFYIDAACKEAVRTGRLTGPRLYVSGIGMRSPKGFGYVGMPVAGDALSEMIHENITHGADWIKFYETGTVCESGAPLGYYNREEIGRIIAAAHTAGRPVTSHCIGGAGLLDSVELGIDCIEHAYYATGLEIERMQAAGTWVCITAGEYFTDKEHAPPAYQAQLREHRPRVRESMERLVRSGIPFVLGTDGLHGRLWEEARYAVGFGASPARVLRALTADAARLLGAEREIGRIAPGMRADLVLLEENPLEKIEALRGVRQVYQNGKAVLSA
ncbi:amidohydrolase family protein [Dysosmobacter sp.]